MIHGKPALSSTSKVTQLRNFKFLVGNQRILIVHIHLGTIDPLTSILVPRHFQS